MSYGRRKVGKSRAKRKRARGGREWHPDRAIARLLNRTGVTRGGIRR